MKNTISILLVAIGFLLLYFCYTSIMKPIEFNRETARRTDVVVEKLTAIRQAQELFYKQHEESYCPDFDSLINFVKTAQVAFLYKEGELTDDQLESGMTEQKAIKLGLIIRDTTYIPFMDTVFQHLKFPVDSLGIIPFSGGKEFEMEFASVGTASFIDKRVMEVRAPYLVFLGDMDRRMVRALVDEAVKWEKYPGIKIGDLTKMNNNAGNWE